MKLTIQLLAILLTVGCATAPPGHDTARQIQSAAGLTNAIEFHTEALPAETTEAADRLTLSAALERALRQSPEVQIALAEVRAAQGAAHQARLLPNPVLSIAFRLPEGGGRTIIEAGLAAELVNILQRPRRISVADAVMRAASATSVTTTLDVMHETQRYYFDAIALRREMQILTDRNSSISKLLKVAKARHAAGESTQLDVATFEADQSTADIDLRDATLKLRRANIALAHRLGQPRGRIDWQLATPLYTNTVLKVERYSIMQGLRARPEIQADRYLLKALEDQTALAKLAQMEGASAGLDTERDSDWSLGPSVVLPLPIFDSGRARRDKARAQAIAARQRLTQTTRQVAREIRQAHDSVTQLMTTTDQARTKLVRRHKDRRNLAKVVFEAGEDVTKLHLAELDLLKAKLKLARLEHRTALAIIALDRATGGNTEDKQNDK